jgi:hypothetical protein
MRIRRSPTIETIYPCPTSHTLPPPLPRTTPIPSSPLASALPPLHQQIPPRFLRPPCLLPLAQPSLLSRPSLLQRSMPFPSTRMSLSALPSPLSLLVLLRLLLDRPTTPPFSRTTMTWLEEEDLTPSSPISTFPPSPLPPMPLPPPSHPLLPRPASTSPPSPSSPRRLFLRIQRFQHGSLPSSGNPIDVRRVLATGETGSGAWRAATALATRAMRA